jgi:hypothetical protein
MLNNQSENLSVSLESLFQQLYDAKPQEKPRLFLEYCRLVIKAKNLGTLSIEEAAYKIAGAMSIRELEEPLFEQITELAGSLELPYHISGVQPGDGWIRLVRLVDEYEQSKNSPKKS